MIKLFLKVLSFGARLGIKISVSIMLIGCIIYCILDMSDFFIPRHFLGYVAWVAFISGVICVIGCFVYVLYLAREYFKMMISKGKDDD